MTLARRLLAHRRLAALLCVAALLLKLMVPSGYMIASHSGHLTVEVCSGMAAPPVKMAMPHAMPMPGHGKPHDGAKPDQPCAFAGLSAAALGAVDAVLLAALIAFVMALAFAPATLPPPLRRVRLRPPLRGPPATL